MQQKAKPNHLGKVLYLGVCFFLIFGAFQSFQNIISDMYDRYNYKGFGQITIWVLYASYGISNVFAPAVLKRIGYRWGFLLPVLGQMGLTATSASIFVCEREDYFYCVSTVHYIL